MVATLSTRRLGPRTWQWLLRGANGKVLTQGRKQGWPRECDAKRNAEIVLAAAKQCQGVVSEGPAIHTQPEPRKRPAC